jgi:hypothetical protein
MHAALCQVMLQSLGKYEHVKMISRSQLTEHGDSMPIIIETCALDLGMVLTKMNDHHMSGRKRCPQSLSNESVIAIIHEKRKYMLHRICASAS